MCDQTQIWTLRLRRNNFSEDHEASITHVIEAYRDMSTVGKSRWADSEEDAALEDRRKKEREEKKRQKAEKQRKLEAAEEARRQSEAPATSNSNQPTKSSHQDESSQEAPPTKRRRLSPEPERESNRVLLPTKLLRFPAPEWGPCRHVDNFEKLNHIEEGSYGWVSRAKDVATGEVVALKKLKMDYSTDGFPVTGLREIQTLMACQHPNIVNLREIVMGDGMSE